MLHTRPRHPRLAIKEFVWFTSGFFLGAFTSLYALHRGLIKNTGIARSAFFRSDKPHSRSLAVLGDSLLKKFSLEKAQVKRWFKLDSHMTRMQSLTDSPFENLFRYSNAWTE